MKLVLHAQNVVTNSARALEERHEEKMIEELCTDTRRTRALLHFSDMEESRLLKASVMRDANEEVYIQRAGLSLYWRKVVIIMLARFRIWDRFEKGGYWRETKKDCAPRTCRDASCG